MRFERILLAGVAAAALLGGERAAGAPEVRHYGPFPSTSPDSGTCGNFWATDAFDRFFHVQTTYDIPTFLLHYNARTNGEWKNASADRGGNQGDITGMP